MLYNTKKNLFTNYLVRSYNNINYQAPTFPRKFAIANLIQNLKKNNVNLFPMFT